MRPSRWKHWGRENGPGITPIDRLAKANHRDRQKSAKSSAFSDAAIAQSRRRRLDGAQGRPMRAPDQSLPPPGGGGDVPASGCGDGGAGLEMESITCWPGWTVCGPELSGSFSGTYS